MTLFRGLRNIAGAAALAGAVLVTAAPTPAHARVFVSVAIAPPAIPVYAQPVMPGEGYIWTPGYWAWNGEGYVWVDGAWVLPPYEGAYWTPGYWGYAPTGYFWNAGYWGPSVGYYGGINYGFGYFGSGFYGGYWSGRRFWYNSCYNRFPYGWKNGYVYNRPYGGHFDGRPGGPAWANHGAMVNGNRGSYYNQRGNNFAESHRNGFNQGRGFEGNRGFENNGGNRYDWKQGGPSANRGGFNQAPAQTMNNGRQFANSGGSFNSGSRPDFNGPNRFNNGGASSPAHNFVRQATESRSFSAPAQSFGSGNRGFSAPAQSFGGNRSAGSFNSGGGFHGGGNFGGGGGGGFHGGGGGGGFHGGGGGGSHGGGGHR